MAKRSELSVAQRREAVLSLLRHEEPGSQLARRYGVSEPTLYRWRDDFLAAGESGLTGKRGRNGHDPQRQRIAELEQQIEKRDQVIGELTIANRILKKAQVGLL